MKISRNLVAAIVLLATLAGCGFQQREVAVLNGQVSITFPAGWWIESGRTPLFTSLHHFPGELASCFINVFPDPNAEHIPQSDWNRRVESMKSEDLGQQLSGITRVIDFGPSMLGDILVLNFEVERIDQGELANQKGRELAVSLNGDASAVMVSCAGAPRQGNALKHEIDSILGSLKINGLAKRGS